MAFSAKRRLGVTIPGLLATFLVWTACIVIDGLEILPAMSIASWLRWMLIGMFSVDILYLLIGSISQLKKSDWGRQLSQTGPYQFVRHPLYSGVIYSTTGLISIMQQSWSLLVSVLPLSILWSWLVQREEAELIRRFGKKYTDYMEYTGQFFPTKKGMKRVAEIDDE